MGQRWTELLTVTAQALGKPVNNPVHTPWINGGNRFHQMKNRAQGPVLENAVKEQITAEQITSESC